MPSGPPCFTSTSPTLAKWKRKLSPKHIVRTFGVLIVVVLGIGLLPDWGSLTLTAPAPPQPWSAIGLGGGAALVVSILIISSLRSRGPDVETGCAGLHAAESVSVHPQSVMNGFRRALTKKEGTRYEMGDGTVELKEDDRGGSFDGLALAEYGVNLERVGMSTRLRRFASLLALVSVGAGAFSNYLIWNAVRVDEPRHVTTAVALWLFGSIGSVIAFIPLCETIWSSYLLGVEVNGSYQGRGAVKQDAAEKDLGWGSILTDYVLDGGVVRAESASYLLANNLKPKATRILVNTFPDQEEANLIQSVLESHLRARRGRRAGRESVR